MSLVKYKHPRSPHRFSSVWDDFFNRNLFDSSSAMVSGNTVPAVNIRESDDAFAIEIAAPGFDKKDFQLELDNGVLNISVERTTDTEKGSGDYSRREFNFSQFRRSFTLPDTVREDKISAEYVSGILTVLVPKKEEAKAQPSRLIKIK